MTKKSPIDNYFFITLIIILAFGLVMVFSASAPFALKARNDSYYYVIRQLIWVGVGLVLMFMLSHTDYHWLAKKSPYFLVGVVLLLGVVLIIGISAKGAQRWIGIGSQQFQPSEFAKIAVILFLSNSLAKNHNNLKSLLFGFVPYLVGISVVAGLVLAERHMSAATIIFAVGIVMMFVAGAKGKHLALLSLGLIPGLIYLVTSAQYRLQRIMAFLDPFKDASDTGFQAVQSLYAIGSGGLFGLGLGQSRQKFLYIPEPQNDFIFSIICEELGLVGALAVLALFAVLIWRGVKIALDAPDMTGMLLAFGIVALIGFEVLINVAVVTSSMPVTGMTLPFFSYGGTSTIVLLGCAGILLNISKHAKNTSSG